MYIKEVLNYEWNYAEYLISDGKNDLICMCESVPLPLGQVPKAGMKIAKINAFTVNEIKIKALDNKKFQSFFIKKGKRHFNYILQGKILNKDKALICIGDFEISLENDFVNGLPNCFKNGDFVEFAVDRLDCTLE